MNNVTNNNYPLTYKYSWVCPLCDTVYNPETSTCPCSNRYKVPYSPYNPPPYPLGEVTCHAT